MNPPIENPTFLLAPNWKFRPGSSICLGNIITNPFKPHIVLSQPDPNSPLLETERAQERDWKLEVGREQNMNVKIWLGFLEGTGLKVAAKHNNQIGTKYEVQTLETVSFKNGVTADLISERVKDSKVATLMNTNYFLSKPVYMVVGLKIATGFRLISHGVTENRGDANVRGPTDGPGSVGAEAGIMGQLTKKYETCSDEIVLAYQLLQISPKGWGNNKTTQLAEYQSSAIVFGGAGGDEGDPPPIQWKAAHFSTIHLEDVDYKPPAINVERVKNEKDDYTIISYSEERKRTPAPQETTQGEGQASDFQGTGHSAQPPLEKQTPVTRALIEAWNIRFN
ncbi:hypothetical protein F5Y10DRAFT_263077 [Nemania abortiva]|nr:hypothetical protein F5Y10DRAFT_263077 [Nemania abortiva]